MREGASMNSVASVSKWLKLPFTKMGEDLGKDTKLVSKP